MSFHIGAAATASDELDDFDVLCTFDFFIAESDFPSVEGRGECKCEYIAGSGQAQFSGHDFCSMILFTAPSFCFHEFHRNWWLSDYWWSINILSSVTSLLVGDIDVTPSQKAYTLQNV